MLGALKIQINITKSQIIIGAHYIAIAVLGHNGMQCQL